FPQCAGISLNRVLDNARALKRVPSMLDQWSGELRSAETAAYLPRINAAVGSGSVDLVSFDQGLVLMNELNYAPRPVFQSYSAYTPMLSALNAEFYRSPSAPKFVMWHQESIDARFPTTEDAQLLLELPRGYVTELEEGGYLLLRRVREIPDHPPRRQLLSERQAGLGDLVAVPPPGRGPIWLQVIMRPSALGSLRAALYKPAQMRIRAVDSGGNHTEWRMLPDVAGDGFLLSPLLATTSDFERFLRDGGGVAVATVQFVAPGGQEKFWDRRITVRFWSLPDLEGERQAAARAGAEPGS
ncbi:MAG TPA: hypothetical protein VN877_01165, partial [Opitutaceae bacterium]|nr:hypothetical protein [Opitutaceae bacterium]